MEDRKFKVGDVVRLKSGGQDMTVDRYDVCGECHCVWFEQLPMSVERGGKLFEPQWGELKRGAFSEKSLTCRNTA